MEEGSGQAHDLLQGTDVGSLFDFSPKGIPAFCRRGSCGWGFGGGCRVAGESEVGSLGNHREHGGAPLDKMTCEESGVERVVTWGSWSWVWSPQAQSLYKHVCGVQNNWPYVTRFYSENQESWYFLSGMH